MVAVSWSDRETVSRTASPLTRTRTVGRRRAAADDPKKIDRFVIQRRLGAGGMSVVYEALDERIGRRVALKLMHMGDADTDRERLRREAQALARVSHPNVVEVYEIGEHDGKAFVAMAVADGAPLDRWLRAQPRTTAEIVGAFVQAGEGLAAAHAHGLVHRDFKPGNVLMGDDGRVRVVDFGLVRESVGNEPSSSAQLPIPAEISGGQLPASAWKETLTRTGAMVGTPAYMSPEQLGGMVVGPASDQFSFCVALYEALLGRHPFVVDGNWQQLPYNVLEGRAQRPTPKDRVLAGLGKIVMRGLAPRPEDRWPGMDVLLPALRRALDRRGPRPAAVAVGLGLLVLGGVALHRSLQTAEEHHCRRGAIIMQHAWNDDVRQELREAWTATKVAGAADTWDRVDARLRASADEWWGIHRAACEGDVPVSSSATCLMRWADGLRAHLAVMERPNEALLHNAVQMLGELPSLDACTAALDAPPDAPAPELPPWQGELVQVDVLLSAGQFEEATPLIEALVARAAAEGSPRLTAEANYRLGRLLMFRVEYEAAGATLEEAYLGAKPLGLDRLAAESAIMLVQLYGEVHHQSDEAARWAGHARAETERVGDPVLESRYRNAWGRALRSEGELEEALVQHEQALAILSELPSADPSDLANTHFQLGSVLGLLERPAEALPSLEQALHIQREQLGPQHPRLAPTLINLGIFMWMTDRPAEALTTLMQAHEVAKVANPNNLRQIVFPLELVSSIHESERRLGQAAHELRRYRDGLAQLADPSEADEVQHELYSCRIARYEGDVEGGLEHCRKALAHVGTAPSPEGETQAWLPDIHRNMAMLLASQGKRDEALASERRAFEATLALVGDERPRPLAVQMKEDGARHALGRALMLAGKHAEALAMLDEAAAAHVALLGEPRLWYHQVQIDAAASLVALGRADEAVARLRPALAVLEARLGPEAFDVQYALATLAAAELEAGNVAAAREVGERVLGLLEARSEPVPELEAHVCFALARSLDDDRASRSKAIALAERAEALWSEQGEAWPPELRRVRAWLGKHGGRVSSARRPT